MFDRELALQALAQIQNAADTVLNRFRPVGSAYDFTDSPAGMEKFDSICMQLIVIGEGLKNLDKITSGELLKCYPQVDWKKAKGLRDVITHKYFDVNTEAIFDVCKTQVPLLYDTINRIVNDLNNNTVDLK